MAKGFVYILRNKAMPGLLKIGYSVKVPTERVEELFTTGVPEPFILTYYCLVDNADKLESIVHSNLSTHRHRGNREFFRIELEEAVKTITSLCKPEHEWSEEQLSKSHHKANNVTGDGDHVILYQSRHFLDHEDKEMKNFIEVASKRGLTSYVISLFYDSNACLCVFEFTDDIDQYDPSDPIALKLLEVATETISQFEWGDSIRHGANVIKDESDVMPD